MRLLSSLALALAIAMGLGVGSAFLAVEYGSNLTAVRFGPWSAPAAEGAGADPYRAAIASRTDELRLGAAEGMAFSAATDSDGEPLSGACSYRLVGGGIPARLWTITARSADGGVFGNPSGRITFNSEDLLRDGAGNFVIAIAASAQPGNWLPVEAAEPFGLTLVLYDTPIATAPSRSAELPRIVRDDCA